MLEVVVVINNMAVVKIPVDRLGIVDFLLELVPQVHFPHVSLYSSVTNSHHNP